MHNESKINQACAYLAETHSAEFASSYGEPGYSSPELGIIFANWNDIPKGLADWLEKCGFELEWSDEWETINDKAYRTSPSSYDWESSIMLTDDGEWLTPDDDASAWIDECAMTDKAQPAKCLPSRITADELAENGFKQYAAELESGFHPGQTDSPADYAKRAFDAGAIRVVFRKTENSQFYIRFECYAEFDDEVNHA